MTEYYGRPLLYYSGIDLSEYPVREQPTMKWPLPVHNTDNIRQEFIVASSALAMLSITAIIGIFGAGYLVAKGHYLDSGFVGGFGLLYGLLSVPVVAWTLDIYNNLSKRRM